MHKGVFFKKIKELYIFLTSYSHSQAVAFVLAIIPAKLLLLSRGLLRS